MKLAKYSKTIRLAAGSVIALVLLAAASVAQSANSLPAVRVEETSGLTASLDGLHATLTLDSEVSSKLPTGASFRALLKAPADREGKTVLPEGTIFEGHLKTVHARRPMRSGSVFVVFDRMILPGSTAAIVSANVTATDSNAVKTGAEGQLRPTVSKKRLVFQLGGTALAAKLSDDLSEAIGGTAISAGTARYAGMAGATTFFLFQKGREVKLRPGDKIEIEFGR